VAGVQRPEALREQLRRGPHSPAPCRVNGAVRHVDAWYDAFGISDENKLYLPPGERVHIWWNRLLRPPSSEPT
jgi:predicted metalloendopeptidase